MNIEPIELQQIHVTKITRTARLDWKTKNGPASLTLTGKDFTNASALVENLPTTVNMDFPIKGQEFLVTKDTKITRS